jgi:hypothetical protein
MECRRPDDGQDQSVGCSYRPGVWETDLGHENVFCTKAVVRIFLIMVHFRNRDGRTGAEVMHRRDLRGSLEPRHEASCDSHDDFTTRRQSDEISLFNVSPGYQKNTKRIRYLVESA